jgi:hypothetical protein
VAIDGPHPSDAGASNSSEVCMSDANLQHTVWFLVLFDIMVCWCHVHSVSGCVAIPEQCSGCDARRIDDNAPFGTEHHNADTGF